MVSDQKPQPNFSTGGQLGAGQMREQTRNAIDPYFGYLRQSVASLPSGGTDVGEKIKSYAEQNIAATHQFLSGHRPPHHSLPKRDVRCHVRFS